MQVISLEKMQFFAHHGWYAEENILGGEFELDVILLANTDIAAGSDDLQYTINYETIYLICEAEMRKPCKLLETLLANIRQNILHQFSQIHEIKISVSKKNPPLGGLVGAASLSQTDNFEAKCGRCSKGMVCYKNEHCWCFREVAFPRTEEHLKLNYRNCVCKNCLTFFGV